MWADAEIIKYRRKCGRKKRQFEEGRGRPWRTMRELDALVERHGGDLDAARAEYRDKHGMLPYGKRGHAGED